MKCLDCKYCLVDDVDPKALFVTFWCGLHQKNVNPISYCSDFLLDKECRYE